MPCTDQEAFNETLRSKYGYVALTDKKRLELHKASVRIAIWGSNGVAIALHGVGTFSLGTMKTLKHEGLFALTVSILPLQDARRIQQAFREIQCFQ